MKEENVKCYMGKREKACCHYNQKYKFKLNKYVQSYIDEILKISLDKCISKFTFVHFYMCTYEHIFPSSVHKKQKYPCSMNSLQYMHLGLLQTSPL